MSTNPAVVIAPQEPARRERKSYEDFRLIPQIEKYPSVVTFTQTPLGKLAVLAAFGIGWHWFNANINYLIQFVAVLALCTFLPNWRRLILAIATTAWVVYQNLIDPLQLLVTLGVITTGMALFFLARRWPHSTFGQRPIIFLLSGFTLLILGACLLPRTSPLHWILWTVVASLAGYVWFIGYALMDRTASPRQEASLEVASLRPFWGSTSTPFPKGANYLRRIEAGTPEQLAVAQLKGLKLLLWAILLAALSTLWGRFFHIYLEIPTSAQALAMSARHTPVAWHVRWESQILAFFESIFSISIMGHQFIACCRIAGFNALRNTYRPLSATTVAEFFNRYYYYFKELLVDFFFFPAFLRYWKGHRRIRLVFANFAAAGFGNAFYHFTRDWSIIGNQGLRGALLNFQVYLFYCVVLASALSISQLRKRRAKHSGHLRGRLLPILGVVLFYCLLDIFGSTQRNYPLVEHLRFFASLFFIRF